jgi:hypothetical protein
MNDVSTISFDKLDERSIRCTEPRQRRWGETKNFAKGIDTMTATRPLFLITLVLII